MSRGLLRNSLTSLLPALALAALAVITVDSFSFLPSQDTFSSRQRCSLGANQRTSSRKVADRSLRCDGGEVCRSRLQNPTFVPFRGQTVGELSMSTSSSDITDTKKNVIIISPTGGVGEVAATTLAKMGNSVRWFAVSPSSSSPSIALPKETWGSIQGSGGEFDVTSGDVEGLLLPEDSPQSTIQNAEQWVAVNALAGKVDGIVVSLDAGDEVDSAASDEEAARRRKELGDAVKRVAQMACGRVPPSVKRVEIVPMPTTDSGEKAEGGKGGNSDEGGLKKWLLNPFQAGNSITLREAVSAANPAGAANIMTFRHGVLYGLPESNRGATPFINGPRREPMLREEYTHRSVLLSATKSRRMDGTPVRTSRLSLADAAIQSLFLADDDEATNSLPKDITLSSLRGSLPLTKADWREEFSRLSSTIVQTMTEDGSTVLFEVTYDDVPNVSKLADWIAYKWAPTVLSTYDIAGIRKGARPVFATRVPMDGENEEAVEIYWQELRNFEETTTVGKMMVRVTNRGIIATRKALAELGEGMLSQEKPFPGENVLVRRLADAAGQATEKGLAIKHKRKKTEKSVEAPPFPAQPVMASSSNDRQEMVQPSTATAAPPAQQQKPDLESGPRTSGARRSSPRRRGKKGTKQEGGEQ